MTWKRFWWVLLALFVILMVVSDPVRAAELTNGWWCDLKDGASQFGVFLSGLSS